MKRKSGSQIRPYVGISDFIDPAQVAEATIAMFKHRSEFTKHVLHVGVMMSLDTFNGIPCRYPGIFPKSYHVSDIFCVASDEDALIYNCLHWLDISCDTKSDQLVAMLDLCGPYLHSLQLDMKWPDPKMVSEVLRKSGKDLDLILQLGQWAFEETPDGLAEKLKPYMDIGAPIRVLLDKSMGRGKPLEPQSLLPYMRTLHSAYPQIGITVAGGLGPGSLEVLNPILTEFPNTSFDAYSRLRPSCDVNDPLDIDIVKRYIFESLSVIENARNRQ